MPQIPSSQLQVNQPIEAEAPDATLDALWDGCEGGDMDACDELYSDSPFGSEYEDFGDSCGGRTDGGTWCSATD